MRAPRPSKAAAVAALISAIVGAGTLEQATDIPADIPAGPHHVGPDGRCERHDHR